MIYINKKIKSDLYSEISKERLVNLIQTEILEDLSDELIKRQFKNSNGSKEILLTIVASLFNSYYNKITLNKIIDIVYSDSYNDHIPLTGMTSLKDVETILLIYFSEEEILNFENKVKELMYNQNSSLRF
jgi:predicted DNA-binding ArsR family transcriptional regulator